MILKGLELKKKRENSGLTQKEFADLVGKSMRTIITWEKSEELSQSQITLINTIFEKHEITTHNNTETNEPLTSYIKTKAGLHYEELSNGKYILTTPLVPIKAQASYVSEYQDADFIDRLEKVNWIVDKIGHGEYRTFEIMNDSMNDATLEKEASRSAILHGDYVLGRKLLKEKWKNKLHFDGVNGYPFWVIVHKDTVMCKQIIDHDVSKGTITCHSLNDSPEFPDFQINLNDVKELYNICKKQNNSY